MSGNGEIVHLPGIMIGWDDQNKVARYKIDWEYFQTYECVFGLLETVKRQLENDQKQVQIAQAIKNAQEQQQIAAIQQDLRKGRVT